MHGENISYAYGFWSLVVINVALFAFFILSFLTPIKKREWRSIGVTLAFFVALFTEMYGFPLTIYILTGVLGSPESLFPRSWPSLAYIFRRRSRHDGYYPSRKQRDGVYRVCNHVERVASYSRRKKRVSDRWTLRLCQHPQYSGLILVMISMVMQWPTIITALMFPVLLYVYCRLSKREEGEMIELFGEEQEIYGKNSYVYSEVKQNSVQECLNLETPSKIQYAR